MEGDERFSRRWPLTLLLVEDDLELAAACCRDLAEGGCLVHLASDGDEALKALGRMRPDAFVWDAGRDGRDRVETMRAVIADARARSIPVIIVSGSDEGRDWACLAGADALLTHPAGGREIRRTVLECLRRAPQAV